MYFLASITALTWENLKNSGVFADAIATLDLFINNDIPGKDFSFVPFIASDLRVQILREARDKGVELPEYLQYPKCFELKTEYSKWHKHHPEISHKLPVTLNSICMTLELDHPSINSFGQTRYTGPRRAAEDVLILANILRTLIKKSQPLEKHPDIFSRPLDAKSDFDMFLGEGSNVIFLSNLPHDTTQGELESWFTQYGGRPIDFWTLRVPDQYKPIGNGFAIFSSHDEAVDCLGLNGRCLNDRVIEVSPSSSGVLERAGEVLVHFPQSKNRPRPGDWTCPNCGFSNFQRRTACFRCSYPFPGTSSQGGSQSSYNIATTTINNNNSTTLNTNANINTHTNSNGVISNNTGKKATDIEILNIQQTGAVQKPNVRILNNPGVSSQMTKTNSNIYHMKTNSEPGSLLFNPNKKIPFNNIGVSNKFVSEKEEPGGLLNTELPTFFSENCQFPNAKDSFFTNSTQKRVNENKRNINIIDKFFENDTNKNNNNTEIDLYGDDINGCDHLKETNNSGTSANSMKIHNNSNSKNCINGPLTLVPFRAGDWKCGTDGCNYHNFAKNTNCLRCGAPRISASVVISDYTHESIKQLRGGSVHTPSYCQAKQHQRNQGNIQTQGQLPEKENSVTKNSNSIKGTINNLLINDNENSEKQVTQRYHRTKSQEAHLSIVDRDEHTEKDSITVQNNLSLNIQKQRHLLRHSSLPPLLHFQKQPRQNQTQQRNTYNIQNNSNKSSQYAYPQNLDTGTSTLTHGYYTQTNPTRH